MDLSLIEVGDYLKFQDDTPVRVVSVINHDDGTVIVGLKNGCNLSSHDSQEILCLYCHMPAKIKGSTDEAIEIAAEYAKEFNARVAEIRALRDKLFNDSVIVLEPLLDLNSIEVNNKIQELFDHDSYWVFEARRRNRSLKKD